jgi:hypothetical protein
MSYKPNIIKWEDVDTSDALATGFQIGFETFEPDPKYSFDGRGLFEPPEWKRTIVPVNAPPVEQGLPQVIQTMVKSAWKGATPSSNRHDNVVIGRRPLGSGITAAEPAYFPQVRPSIMEKEVLMNDSVIATDWHLFNGIERTNAITFRGDSRSPFQVMTVAKGFHPPETRTDEHYLNGPIYSAFKDYYKRRYDRVINLEQFVTALAEATKKEPNKTKMFIDYMSWRGLMKREASHLGRMASNELLKGYISTSRAIDSAMAFGCKANMTTDGYYIYVVQVNSGFVVPDKAQIPVQWATDEAEIAQLGAIPAERIHGFRKFVRSSGAGPIYMRKSFRKDDNKAFKQAFKILSGARPDQVA